MQDRHAPFPTPLFNRNGGTVVVVKVPAMLPRAEGIAWNGRVFFRDADGWYREGLLYKADAGDVVPSGRSRRIPKPERKIS